MGNYEVSYHTQYIIQKSYIEKNQKEIEGFTRSIQKELNYIHNHTKEKITEHIINYFPDTSINDLIKMVHRYDKNDS